MIPLLPMIYGFFDVFCTSHGGDGVGFLNHQLYDEVPRKHVNIGMINHPYKFPDQTMKCVPNMYRIISISNM